MPDPDDRNASEPRTLRLQRKRHALWLLVLAGVAVVAAMAFAAYKIYSATLPPEIP